MLQEMTLTRILTINDSNCPYGMSTKISVMVMIIHVYTGERISHKSELCRSPIKFRFVAYAFTCTHVNYHDHD